MGFSGPVVCFLPFRHTQGREGFNFPEKFFTVVLGLLPVLDDTPGGKSA